MFVVVAVVRGVAVAVVDVVDMVAVRDGHMAAALTVHMVVAAVFGMRRGLAFVVVAGMLAVQVAVVDVVHVVAVRYRDMAAVRSVFVLVFGVLSMCRCHERSFFPRNGQLELRTQLHYQVRISADSHMFADLVAPAARDTHTERDSGPGAGGGPALRGAMRRPPRRDSRYRTGGLVSSTPKALLDSQFIPSLNFLGENSPKICRTCALGSVVSQMFETAGTQPFRSGGTRSARSSRRSTTLGDTVIRSDM